MSDPIQEHQPPLSTLEKKLIGLVLLLISGLLVCVGGLGIFLSIFCFLGGPAARIGFLESLAFGGVFFVTSTALLVVGILATKAGLHFFRLKK
jgi:hypothetical protein